MISKSTAIVGFILSFIAGMFLIWSVHRTAGAPGATAEEGAAVGAVKKSANAVPVEFYVMSQCPHGVKVVDAVKDVVDKLGADMDFKMEFIGKVGQGGELTSMHGPPEVKGDMVQLCAAKHAPGKYLEMVVCQNKDFRNVATNWEQCAQQAKLPVAKIRKCLEGKEGEGLLRASFERAKKRGATGSPTLFVGGEPYRGQRTTAAFLRAVCGAFKGPKKPPACQGLAPQVPVNVTVLNDKRCTSCNTARLTGVIQKNVAKPVIKNVDYADAEGKKLFEEIGGGMLPVAIFDQTLGKDPDAQSALQRFLKPAGTGRQKFEYRATWNPKCANEGGCELEECKDSLHCRQETPGTLEVFVMSQCPFGVRALNAMEQVLEHFDKELKFYVHFIASGTAKDGFKALHGQPEVDENIRELCAIKHYGQNYEYMDYILCRNKDIRSTDWEKCTGETGIATATIKACFEGDEGKKLHEEDIKIGQALGISASPTWVANGRYKFSGVKPEVVIQNVCRHNADMKGCDKSGVGAAADKKEAAKPAAPAPKPKPKAPAAPKPPPKPKGKDPVTPFDDI